MSKQTIHSQDIEIATVFKDFYVVPDYQREYVWETEQVEQLLGDINDERTGNDLANAPEYFIGSIVVCPRDDEVLELIDGQQRMTTLFLILCAIRDRIKKLEGEEPEGFDSMIAYSSFDLSGRSRFRYRLDLQYEDSGEIIKHIAKGTLDEADGSGTRSIENILNAYKVVLNFLNQEFKDEAKDLRAFHGYLFNKVKLIRIQTEDVAKALKIFETINDRGVSLDSMDLLKNLLFMKACRTDFDKLKDQWKELKDTIYGMKEKPLRFLRYFVLSRYNVEEILREDEIYGWFSKNEEQCGYAADPVAFTNKLLNAAKDYKRLWKDACDSNGAKNPYLESIGLLAGGATRQHLILLLAGRHLSPNLFDRLTRHVEEILFVYLITGEPARNWERYFARWAKELRKVTEDDAAGLESFINHSFARAKANFAERFDDAFQRLSYYGVQRYRLRYILAKLTQYIDEQAWDSPTYRQLNRYTNRTVHIEHILSETPTEELRDAFDKSDEYEDYVVRLGNLTLLEDTINSSICNGSYTEKMPGYKQSSFLLTKSLAEKPHVGSDTRLNRAVADLIQFECWNSQMIQERQEMLTELARKVWGMSTTSKDGVG